MTSEGEVFAWGYCYYGQLGLGICSDSFEPGIGSYHTMIGEPQLVTSLANARITQIYAGYTFSIFLSHLGEIFACGMNDLGQLGMEKIERELPLSNIYIYIYILVPSSIPQRAGHYHPPHKSRDITIPTKVDCFEGIPVCQLACGENHALAVTGEEKNMLWSWGMFNQGQLGLGPINKNNAPRPIQTLTGAPIYKVYSL